MQEPTASEPNWRKKMQKKRERRAQTARGVAGGSAGRGRGPSNHYGTGDSAPIPPSNNFGDQAVAARADPAPAPASAPANPTMPSSSSSSSSPTDTPRFADLAKDNLIAPVLLQTIVEDLKFDRMSPVQAATLEPLLRGKDLLAQAKTGTGKTVAFLLPAIQHLLRAGRTRHQQQHKQVSVLILSPTRELALQIAAEAKVLLNRVPQYTVQTAIGGTGKAPEQNRILKGCDILVATPGRLLDHLEEPRIRDQLQHITFLILDEADRLLDMGFMPSLKKIVAALPDRQVVKRQGVLFSATVPEHVEKVGAIALAPGYTSISTVPKGESNLHERVPQQLVVTKTFADVAPALLGLLRSEAEVVGKDKFKAIVFAPTAALVDFYVELLSAFRDLPKVEGLHARISQSRRTKTTDSFRKATTGILIATDVIARGMDFPAVTNVIQAGMSTDKESYTHRLGRTARAGAEGRGSLIVAQPELFFPRRVLAEVTFHETAPDLSAKADVVAAVKQHVQSPRKVYQAWLGFYKTSMKSMGWNPGMLVKEANVFARAGLGVTGELPAIKKSTVSKMGLKGVPGIRVISDKDWDPAVHE